MYFPKGKEKLTQQEIDEYAILEQDNDQLLIDERNPNINNDVENLTFNRIDELTKKEPSYVMTIELEKGKSDIIQIFTDSSPDELAFEFCKKNNLNLKAMNFLTAEISKLLSKITIQTACIKEEPEEESIREKSLNSIVAAADNQNDQIKDEEYQDYVEEAKQGKTNKYLNYKNKSNTVNFSENIDKSDSENFSCLHFDTELQTNNKLSSNSLVDRRRQILIIKNNDTNYLVNKESAIAPVCSSNYPSRRFYEAQEQNRNSAKSYKTNNYKNNRDSVLNKKQKQVTASSKVNNDLNINLQNQAIDNNVITKEMDNLCLVGSGNSIYSSNIQEKNIIDNIIEMSDKKKVLEMINDPKFINKNNLSLNTNNNNNNPFKRLKVKDSPENNRTDPVDYVEDSFDSDKSGIKDKMNNQDENRDFQKTSNKAMTANYNRNDYDLDENTVVISNNNIANILANKNKSSNSIIDNSSFNKSHTGNIFNYNDFFNKMRNKISNKADASTSVSQKISINENTNLKKNSEIILQKLNNQIESKIINERARSRPRIPEKVAPHQYVNIGERLYHKGIQEKQIKAKKIDEIKENIYRDEKKILTFKPNINKLSPFFKKTNEQVEKNRNSNNNLRLSQSAYKPISAKVKKQGANLKSKENYTFTPQIDKKSREIYNQKLCDKLTYKNITPEELKNLRISEMHERAKHRKNTIKKLDQQIYGSYNFTPNFNTNYLVESTFDERLEYFKNKSKEKKLQLEKEMKSKSEKDNGKRFFTPTLISRQITRENQQHSDIYDYMYSFAKKYDSNKINRNETDIKQIRQNSRSIHTTNDSDNIINKLKQQSFDKIFKLIDSDQDQIISKFCMDLKKIPEEIKNIMRIITREIIEDDQTLNKQEFMLACDQLYEMLNYEERKIILNFDKNYNKISKKQPSQNFSFKPKINKNSRRIDQNLPYYISKTLSTSEIIKNKSFDI